MQEGAEFVVMVETTITANGKTIENPIIRVTRPQAASNPRFVYFIDNQTVGQPRHWYVGDGNGNVVVSDVDVVDSTTSTALGTALTDKLTAAGYLSGTHTGTVNDVPDNYGYKIVLSTPPVPENGYYRLSGLSTQWVCDIEDGLVKPCYWEYGGRWLYYQPGPGYVTKQGAYPADFGDDVIQYLTEKGYIVTFDAYGIKANPAPADIQSI